jgi:hypothetical protein
VLFDHGESHALSDEECRALLASTNFGRASLTLNALPVVLPVSYAYLGGSILLGMQDGPAFRTAARGNVIALSVDNAPPGPDFWTVLAIGPTTVAEPVLAKEAHQFGLTDARGEQATHHIQLFPNILTGYRATSA